VIRETSPDIGTVDYLRDATGRVTQKTDGRGVVSRYSYDDAGRLTGILYPEAPAENVVYTYDATANGNLGRGELTGVVDASGSSSYTFDIRIGVASATHVIGGRSYTVRYNTDIAGRPSLIVYPSGRSVGTWRNASGQVSAIRTRLKDSDPWVDLAVDLATHPSPISSRA
jgi:YD repeat-containing protein